MAANLAHRGIAVLLKHMQYKVLGAFQVNTRSY